jgi:hypothetical protein
MFLNFHLLPIIRSLVSRQRPATHIVSFSIRNFSAHYFLDFFGAKKKYLAVVGAIRPAYRKSQIVVVLFL